jgi:hypothetical protein
MIFSLLMIVRKDIQYFSPQKFKNTTLLWRFLLFGREGVEEGEGGVGAASRPTWDPSQESEGGKGNGKASRERRSSTRGGQHGGAGAGDRGWIFF